MRLGNRYVIREMLSGDCEWDKQIRTEGKVEKSSFEMKSVIKKRREEVVPLCRRRRNWADKLIDWEKADGDQLGGQSVLRPRLRRVQGLYSV